jgi:ribonuclease Z
MLVTLLGTGTPAPSRRRRSSGYVVAVGHDVIAIDHGAGAHERLLESGYSATDVTHLFLSHLHYDHCIDYPRLVMQRWDIGGGQVAELDVFGPPPLARMTELLFGHDGAFAPDINARLHHQSSLETYVARGGVLPRQPPTPHVREVRSGDTITTEHWTMRVGHAQHVQPHLDCVAYRLDSPEGSLCYSGDSGLCDELVDLARGCDVLIQMNHHFSGTEPSEQYRLACGNHVDNAELAARAGVKTLVLTHLLPQLDTPGVREEMVFQIRRRFDGAVIWGEDLMRLSLGTGGVGSIEAR